MEYISAEEFSKQPEEIQKVFLDWWQPSVGDIAVYKAGHSGSYSWYMSCISCESDIKKVMHEIPLLTEGQLIKFIEDKTKKKITIIEFDYDHWNIVSKFGFTYITDKADLLQAYWKLACEIAKESIKE